MKTITIQQPWAQLICDGKKKTEYRTWSTNHRGKLAIHAGQVIDKEECRRVGLDPDSLPRGCVICIVEMYGCKKTVGTPDSFGWQLRNVRKIRPVRARGKLGLWTWDRK